MMKHKVLYIIAAAAAVLSGTAACNKASEQDFNPNDPSVMTIVVQPDSLGMKAVDGSATFTFTAPDYWFVSSPVDWLSFEPESGKPGENTLVVKGKQNIGAVRSALVTITANKQRGTFKVGQDAWPYSQDTWTLFGTVKGGDVVPMEDKDAKLVWQAAGVPYYIGETFKLRRGLTGEEVLGLAGELVADESASTPTYKGTLKWGGESITLPEHGYWDITLNLNDWSITAVLAGRYPWTLVGTIDGSNWDKDFEMEDKGDGLLWDAAKISYNKGEVFKFRMNGLDAYKLGLDGELKLDTEAEGIVYTGSVKEDGSDIALPDYGYWNITLDIENKTVSATLAQRFPWSIIGTVDGTNWDTDFTMEDVEGNQLVWENAKLPVHSGEVFKFRMNSSDLEILGLDGEMTAVPEAENTYTGSLKKDGDAISMPAEGYWDIVLDLEKLTVTATFAEEFPKPDPNPLPWNWVPVWENDGSLGVVSWDGIYRFGLDGTDGNNECAATFPADVWERMKSETVYVYVSGANPQIRVTTGWWSANLTDSDIQPGNELLTDNEAETWILELNLAGSGIVDMLDQQHLLFTGDRYTILGLYMENNGGNDTVFWQNSDPEGNGAASWNGVYRFALEGTDGNNEAIAQFPQDVWDKMKSETFCVVVSGASPQIRVVTGWWNNQWPDATDIQPGNELLADNGDGTWTLTMNLAGSDLAAAMDAEHLLFTGGGFTPLSMYFPGEPLQETVWQNSDPEGNGVVSWNGIYRYALEGNDTNNEAIATFPQDVWDRLKTETFYVDVAGTSPQIRVVTGWWNNQWPDATDIQPGNELLADNGDGTWTLTMNLAGSDLAGAMDTEHLLFTGGGFTPMRIYFIH